MSLLFEILVRGEGVEMVFFVRCFKNTIFGGFRLK